jgi:hypothetical protein
VTRRNVAELANPEGWSFTRSMLLRVPTHRSPIASGVRIPAEPQDRDLATAARKPVEIPVGTRHSQDAIGSAANNPREDRLPVQIPVRTSREWT